MGNEAKVGWEVEEHKHRLGMVFNYLVRASVCKMYASDYDQYSGELEDYTVEESLFGLDAWKLISSLMKGFMNDQTTDMEMKCR